MRLTAGFIRALHQHFAARLYGLHVSSEAWKCYPPAPHTFEQINFHDNYWLRIKKIILSFIIFDFRLSTLSQTFLWNKNRNKSSHKWDCTSHTVRIQRNEMNEFTLTNSHFYQINIVQLSLLGICCVSAASVHNA